MAIVLSCALMKYKKGYEKLSVVAVIWRIVCWLVRSDISETTSQEISDKNSENKYEILMKKFLNRLSFGIATNT